MAKELTVFNPENIKSKIYSIHGVKVMLDRDLAELYNLETRVLKQAVNRNIKRFPPDFMFILTEREINLMVSQNVIPSKKHLGKALPYAFTEQGVANLSSVLNSEKANHFGASLKYLGKKWFGFSKHEEINFLCAENVFAFSCV